MISSKTLVPTTVGIIDVGIANLGSIERTLRETADEVVIVKEAHQISEVDRLVLPGVGAFPVAMARLSDTGLAPGIRDFAVDRRQPILGICLGMQLLASLGEEYGTTPGLDLIPGRVRRFDDSYGSRIPHVGWNSVDLEAQSPLFIDIPTGMDFYFVHSFVFEVQHQHFCSASATNGERFSAVVQSDNVVGVQFHPEKSSRIGRRLLRNFCEWSPC
jgi:glutamine amidotransferase